MILSQALPSVCPVDGFRDFKQEDIQVRKPTKSASFAKLKQLGVPVSQVIDVGVMTGTSELMESYPKVQHLLFEPVAEHFSTIEKNYSRAGINYRLCPVALGATYGRANFFVQSVRADGVPTHSGPTGISDNYRVIQVDMLDGYEISMKPDYLLKIDVDGEELSVLDGAANVLKYASVVVIEVAFDTFNARLSYLLNKGFQLFDIVDLCYYDDQWIQADLVMVNPKFLKTPYHGGTFSLHKWRTLT